MINAEIVSMFSVLGIGRVSIAVVMNLFGSDPECSAAPAAPYHRYGLILRHPDSDKLFVLKTMVIKDSGGNPKYS